MLCALLGISLSIQANNEAIFCPPDKEYNDGQSPTVFLIGENTETFEKLSGKYETTLITACNGEMGDAYRKWMELMIALETYAEDNDFDINGSKMWIKFFWGEDGTIDHIAYHLKPNSRNIDTKSLTNLLEGFVAHYQMPVKFEYKFSHYASASFPTFYKRALSE